MNLIFEGLGIGFLMWVVAEGVVGCRECPHKLRQRFGRRPTPPTTVTRWKG